MLNFVTNLRRLSVANFSLVRKGDQIMVGVVPAKVIARPINGSWIMIQEEDEMRTIVRAKDIILGDILARKTSRFQKDYIPFDNSTEGRGISVPRTIARVEAPTEEFFPRKPRKVYYAALLRVLKENRRAEARKEQKAESRGVKESYEFIVDPRVTAVQDAKDAKAKANMKRRFMRRRAKLDKS